ncbi:MAG: caspase family protein [Burkholderiales bacterium]
MLYVVLLATTAGAVHAAPAPIRRFALLVGANHGAAERVPLRYAVADADRFAAVLTQMGGVQIADCVVLREPTRLAFLAALKTTRERASAARLDPATVEVLVYFSGHADEHGLMLGRELLSYRELREAVGEVGADVGITILDACASGAITRLKGGKTHPAFLTDASSEVRGYAFLTSSSENEAAQESERLKGSFFTQALLTGLRGAADVSGDGKVTLGEAYQFAFGETLAQTTTSQAGAQHPAYDIKMAGTGDVVMTDVRQTTASLILGEEYDGRFFVLDARRHLVAELFKPYGRRVELGLEPGEYEVQFEEQSALLASSIKLAEGQRLELSRDDLKRTRRAPTQRRGEAPAEAVEPDLLDARTRIQVSGGIVGVDVNTSSYSTSVGDLSGSLTFLHWIKPNLGLELSFMERELGVVSNPAEARVGGLWGVLFGGRYYPRLPGRIRPYLGAGIGTFAPFGVVTTNNVSVSHGGDAQLAGSLGGGVDLFLGRHFTIVVDSRLMLIHGRSSEFDLQMGFGWTWGGR